MAQELCEYDLVNPSVTWVYRDEDFGGSMSKVPTHRGGASIFSRTTIAFGLEITALVKELLTPVQEKFQKSTRD